MKKLLIALAAGTLLAWDVSWFRTPEAVATSAAQPWPGGMGVWKLARSLDGQPQVMMQTAALTMARMINAVAWKMPLPAPAWLAELQQHDPVPPLLAAFQYSTASYWEDGARMFPTKWLADSVEKDRRIAAAVFRETRCDVNVPMNDLGVALRFVWRRAFRYPPSASPP